MQPYLYLRSSSSISRLKTTMYSPSIAVGVSTLNRGAVQWRGLKNKHATRIGAGRIDAPFKLSPSANAQAASARTIAAIFISVYIPRVLVRQSDARLSYHTPYKVTEWSHGCPCAHAQIRGRVTEHVGFVSSTPLHNASLDMER